MLETRIALRSELFYVPIIEVSSQTEFKIALTVFNIQH